MKLSKSVWVIVFAWAFFVGGFAAISLLMPAGPMQNAAGDIILCIVPLFANACLLWNASTPYRRQNSFWMLLALGCTLWLVGQLAWTYADVVQHAKPFTSPALDMVFFLHTVPLMGALALMPHARKMRETLRYGHLDLLLLAIWWFFLYNFVAFAWSTDNRYMTLYHLRDLQVYAVANLVFVAGIAVLALRTQNGWRTIYGNLFGATAMYLLGLGLVVSASIRGSYHGGSLSTLPIVAAFVWYGTAGIVAHRIAPSPTLREAERRRDERWPARLAILCILSMPLLAVWSAFFSHTPTPVQQYRLIVTLLAILLGTAMVFYRQQLVDRERIALMQGAQDSLENLKRLQMQFVQAEKLASLGQLAAGAAHEINNPLTAILGYAEMIQTDQAATERSRTVAEKIRDQARRTKVLVTNLLSFARQVPAEKQLLDLKSVLTSAIELRQLDLRDKKIHIALDTPSVLPAVRGDPNQLLQVFYNLISNAVDAMEAIGGGSLTVRTQTVQGTVVLEFTDTGPGLKEPERVFDPFYTTKPVGKGTGLGLSICYGIIQEHGGQITGFNRPEGGTTFRIVLPAVLALFPQLAAVTTAKMH